MSEEEIRKFCEDFAFDFTTKLSCDHYFDDINGYTLERVFKDLAKELEVSIKRMISFNKLVKKQ